MAEKESTRRRIAIGIAIGVGTYLTTALINWIWGNRQPVGTAIAAPALWIWHTVLWVWHWLSTTIPVSRGQCVVWFLLGLGLSIAWRVVQHWRARRLEVESYERDPNGHKATLLHYFAINRGNLYLPADAADVTGLSAVRIDELLEWLERTNYIEPIPMVGGWKLAQKGRKFVMARGWA